MSEELPHWTRYYSKDVDENDPFDSRLGIFTSGQKSWLEKAWREYCHGHLPDVFAVHRHKCGLSIATWILAGPYEWHHIIPGQDCLAHGENPDHPENAIPLPKKLHTGINISPIHVDVSDAKWLWQYHVTGRISDPFIDIRKQHAQAAIHGHKYWYPGYDKFFLDLASQVISSFRQIHSDQPWPIRKLR